MKEKNLQTLTQYLSHMQMQEDICESIIAFMFQHYEQIVKQAITAYEGEVPAFPITAYSPKIRLAIILYKLIDVHKLFQQKKIPDTIFYATIQDIALRTHLYYAKRGTIGLSKDDSIWFRHIIHFHIFKIGVLQFQLFHMVYLDQEELGWDYMHFRKEDKQQLPTGTPVINVHVQKGADFTKYRIDQSFEEALTFFQTYFPQHQPVAFVCYSWLLYPDNKKLLKPDAKILYFASKFQLLSHLQIPDEAIKRIYGKRYRKVALYPQNTQLQRNALHHFSFLGEACGVRYIKT